jgi:choline dehydrogenase
MNFEKNQLLDKLEYGLLTGNIDRRSFMKTGLAAGVLSATSLEALADELVAIRENQNKRGEALGKSYDYIVVGSGCAGSALVGTIAKTMASAKILLIEAGDWDTAPSIQDPKIWFTNLGTERDWGDVSIPSASTNNRGIPEHTGRVLGGGSSINATIWARPFKADMDHWAKESGDKAWGYEHSLKTFKSIENWRGAPSKYRGTSGPVWVQPAFEPTPLAPAMLAGCKELGLPVVSDLNGEREITGSGFGLMNQIIKDGRRYNMARAYLYPVMAQKNVTVLVNTQVNKVVLEGDKAVGVEVVRNGKTFVIRAAKEIVLSAGGFNTPKILQLSGIGDEADLKAVNIKTLVNSTEVGKNVQDHILHGGCLFEPPEPIPYANSAANASGYYKTNPALELPDVSIVQIEIPYSSPEIAKEYSPPKTAWALCGGLVAPKSRGTVKLKSNNPNDRPIVDMQFLSHPDDVKALSSSIEIARSIANTSAMKKYVVREVAPGKKLEGAEMEKFIRNGATTYFHSAGACRMGKDNKAVVDSKLRVRGVRNLRIADSTIMPRIVAVPTMPACVLIGKRMAEILKG